MTGEDAAFLGTHSIEELGCSERLASQVQGHMHTILLSGGESVCAALSDNTKRSLTVAQAAKATGMILHLVTVTGLL